MKDIRLNCYYGSNDEVRKQLKKIHAAQKKSVLNIFLNKFYVRKNVESSIDVKKKQAQCIQKMQQVNKMNWQYLILQKDLREIPINDYESMVIGHAIKIL